MSMQVIERLSQKDRREQRRRAAMQVAAGEKLGKVANQFGMSLDWIRKACEEHQVVVPRKEVDASRVDQGPDQPATAS